MNFMKNHLFLLQIQMVLERKHLVLGQNQVFFFYKQMNLKQNQVFLIKFKLFHLKKTLDYPENSDSFSLVLFAIVYVV